MPAKITIVEDNPANLQLMAYLLNAFGHEVLTSTDGESALLLLEREPCDLILCDIHLPRMDGYAVVKWLKQHPVLRSKPVVAVTALAMVGDREKVLAAGFDGYLSKPIVPQTFVSQTETFLQKEKHSISPPAILSRPGPRPAPARMGAPVVAVVNKASDLAELHKACAVKNEPVSSFLTAAVLRGAKQ